MIYRFDARTLRDKGFEWAVVLQYARSLAEPRGTLLSKHRTYDAAAKAAGPHNDTVIVNLDDVALDQQPTRWRAAVTRAPH